VKRALLVAAGLGALVPTLALAAWTLSGDVEHFHWHESTRPSVTEDGLRYGIGGRWLAARQSGWLLGWRGKLYWGPVDYEGATLFGNTPVRGTTRYSGAMNEFLAIFRPKSERLEQLDFVGSLGLDAWERRLSRQQSEDYAIVFARLGAAYNARAPRGWFGGGGVKKPLVAREDAHLRDIGFDQNPILKPGKDPSLYAQVGYRFSPDWSLLGYYDSYRFGRSRARAVTSGGASFLIFQPESRMDLLGVRLAYRF
jgi:hypothetical protein